MMPQKEVNEALYQQADPAYGRYEGNQTSSARQQYETSYEQELREGSSGKVYPLPRDNSTILHFALSVIALLLLLVFGLVFVVVIGGTARWISFAAACFAICCILAYSYATMPRRH
jgi:hypothetical protein